MHFSNDLALMNTQPRRIKVDDATEMITEVYVDVQTVVRGKLLNLVILTNLFETLYPQLPYNLTIICINGNIF